MIHHVSLGTNDLKRARAFYDPVLRTLGLRLIQDDGESLDYGGSDIFFSLETPVDKSSASPGNGVHVAFEARDRTTVQDFHDTALANGGTDAGQPGIREQYDKHYYGAFVRDPDGNKIEAVTYAAK